MRLRTYILILLLLSQPAGAMNGFWQAGPANATTAAHCDGKSGDVAPDLLAEAAAPAAGHSDCKTDCGMCAACTLVMSGDQRLTDILPAIPQGQYLRLLLPPGARQLLYRPPISS